VVGSNLRRLQTTPGLSLERLAHASGVSRAMLCQIELGQSTPTINTIWKIARGLELPIFSPDHESARKGNQGIAGR
jgi:transcriptional regulator with XRE-family HTH domain